MKRIITLFTLLFVASSTMALNPSRTYAELPEKYEAHDVKTEDGVTLKAWYLPNSKKTTKLILIAHDGEGNMGDYLKRANMFLNNGYSVVMFDYRGYGESDDFEIDNNMYIYPHFTDDMEAMIDFMRTTYNSTFDIYGFGIGAGLGLGIGYSRPEVKRIIADTPFLSMEDLEKRFSSWDEPMEVPFAGYDKKYEPLYSVDNTPGTELQGVKLIIGSNDILYKQADLESITKKAPKKFEKISVVENPTPEDNDNFDVDPIAYEKLVVSFLGK